jgi:hypothetical protein
VSWKRQVGVEVERLTTAVFIQQVVLVIPRVLVNRAYGVFLKQR